MNTFEKEIARILKKEGLKELVIESPPNSKLGDYAVPCFLLSKTLKKAPNQIAQELAKKIKSKFFVKIESNGPYINFFAKTELLAKEALQSKEKISVGKGKKVMIEFSSPNTNKPLHLGHIRNIVIGESMSRLYEKSGYRVIRGCLVNDRGVHISKSMIAYKKWGKNKQPDKKSDHFVGDWYVRFSKEAEKKPDLETQAQEMLVKWEANDNDTVALWKKMNNWVYKGFNKTYKELGIKFDKTYYESNFYKKGKSIVLDGLKKGVFVKDDKENIVAELSKKGFSDDKIVLRGDGTSIYITQDLALAKIKQDEFKLDKSYYVVGSEQILHFKQLFEIIDMLKILKTENLHHVSYGHVNLPEGKMKSREGIVVDADDLIREVVGLARKEIEKRHKLSKPELEKRSKVIGVGALKFFILKMDPTKDMTYNPKESVSFEGETGPYAQYAHARINSILKKGKIKSVSKNIDYKVFDDTEKELIKKIWNYDKVVLDSAYSFKPSLVARYLLELAQMFSEYYNTHQILKEKRDVKNARILLISKVKERIKDGLNLLGIDAPEQM